MKLDGTEWPDPSEMPEANKMLIDRAVEHPDHYQTKTGLEVFDIMESFNMSIHVSHAIKYILRAGKKGSYEQDIKKAIQWLNRDLTHRKEEQLGGVTWRKEPHIKLAA